MTRTMRSGYECDNCGSTATAETEFERWVRNNRSLDSRIGLVRYDLDMLLHRYKFGDDRMHQAMMFIEVKTHGKKPEPEQMDTLHIFDQLLSVTRPVFSVMSKKNVTLHGFGGHLLQLSGTNPIDSEWMYWDEDKIGPKMLEKLLLFELDPRNPKEELTLPSKEVVF